MRSRGMLLLVITLLSLSMSGCFAKAYHSKNFAAMIKEAPLKCMPLARVVRWIQQERTLHLKATYVDGRYQAEIAVDNSLTFPKATRSLAAMYSAHRAALKPAATDSADAAASAQDAKGALLRHRRLLSAAKQAEASYQYRQNVLGQSPTTAETVASLTASVATALAKLGHSLGRGIAQSIVNAAIPRCLISDEAPPGSALFIWMRSETDNTKAYGASSVVHVAFVMRLKRGGEVIQAPGRPVSVLLFTDKSKLPAAAPPGYVAIPKRDYIEAARPAPPRNIGQLALVVALRSSVSELVRALRRDLPASASSPAKSK